MTLPVACGDGIGPAVTEAALVVLTAAGWTEDFERRPFGWDAWRRGGEAVPEATLAAIRDRGVALLGAGMSAPGGPASPILALRRALGLDLLVRPVRSERLDVVVVGHALAGEYGSVEGSAPRRAQERPLRVDPTGAVLAAALMARHVGRVCSCMGGSARRRSGWGRSSELCGLLARRASWDGALARLPVPGDQTGRGTR